MGLTLRSCNGIHKECIQPGHEFEQIFRLPHTSNAFVLDKKYLKVFENKMLTNVIRLTKVEVIEEVKINCMMMFLTASDGREILLG